MNTMIAWISFAPTLLVAATIVLLPGLVVTSLLRLRGLLLLAAAAPISVSLIAVAALLSPIAGLVWSPLPVGILTVVAAASAILWTRFVGRSRPVSHRGRGRRWPVILAVLVPAAIIGFVLVRSIGSPEYFAQRYDNFFHLNAVQYVLDTGNASPLWLGTMTSGDTGRLPFYPSGWHALVSLVVMVSGSSVMYAVNAVVIVVAAAIWPLAAVLLVRTLLGRARSSTLAGGVLAAAFPAFPFLPLHYGVLYPLFLGLACMPVALAAAASALRPGHRPGRQLAILLVVLMLPGIAIAHPGAFIAFAALSVPLVIALVIARVRHAESARVRFWWILGVLCYATLGAVALIVLRPPADQIHWGVIESLPQAIGEVVSASVYQYPIAWGLSCLLLIGAYSVIRHPSYSRWVVLGVALTGSALYVIVAGSTSETLRLWLTGPWYNNAPRLASIWVAAVLPLGALGATSLLRFVLRRVEAMRTVAAARPSVTAVIGIALLVIATQGAAMRQAAADIEYTHKLRAEGPILTPDEFALILRLPQLVPADAVIAGDPYTGSSFAYGMAGRRVLMPHLLMEVPDAARVINTQLDTAGDAAPVCEALKETRVRYVLDFSADGDFMENEDDYSGLDGLASSPYAELIAQEGDAKLFRITSCGLTS